MLMKLSNDLYAVSEDYLKKCGVIPDGHVREMVDLESSYPAQNDQVRDLLRQRRELKKESIEYYHKYMEAMKFANAMFTENEQLKIKVRELEYMLADKKAVSKVVREMEGGQWG